MSSAYWNTTADAGKPQDSKFVGVALNPIPASDVVATFLSAKNRTRHRIVTPAVRQAAQRHFACPTLSGVPLEDDFGGSSHWDQRLLEGEIMDPVAGTDTFVGRHIVSNITLALLQDTGWCAWLLFLSCTLRVHELMFNPVGKACMYLCVHACTYSGDHVRYHRKLG